MSRDGWETDWYKHLKVCGRGCKDTPKQRNIFFAGWHNGREK